VDSGTALVTQLNLAFRYETSTILRQLRVLHIPLDYSLSLQNYRRALEK